MKSEKKEKWDLNNYHWLKSDDTQHTKGMQPIKKNSIQRVAKYS